MKRDARRGGARSRGRRVVFLGDFNADLILDGLEGEPLPDREVGCASFDVVVGSSSCIAATAYARLGGHAAICGLRGNDWLGDFVCARLAEAGVGTRFARPSTTAGTGVTVNLVRGAGRAQVTYAGAMAQFSAEHVPAAVFRGMRHLHVSGVYQARSLLPGVAGLLRGAAGHGATTSLDCQWDPTERWEGLDEWLSRVDWHFVNEQEAASMTGEARPADALRGLASRTRCPVLKAGAAGAWVVDRGEPRLVPGYVVPVVDTIGAGDTFDAALLYGILDRRMSLPEAARFANAAAARSCTFRGGTAAGSSLADVTRFMDESRVATRS